MKGRRTFQIATALLGILFAIVLLGTTLLTVCDLLGKPLLKPFFAKLSDGIRLASIHKWVKFLPLNKWGPVIFAGVTFGFTGLLMLIGSVVLFLKPGKKQGGKNFAVVLVLLGMVIFTVISELFAKLLFGDIKFGGADGKSYVFWMIIFGVACAFMLFLGILALIAKAPQPKAVEEAREDTSEFAGNVDRIQPADTAQPTEQPIVEPVEPQPETEQVAPQPAVQSTQQPTQPKTPATEYLPDDNRSVREVVDKTYGGAQHEDISPKTLEKIQTLRGLLDAGAISKDEYIALVNAYLGMK